MHPELEKLVASGRLAVASAEKLSALEPDTYCLHKSWGPGKVAEWDLMGDRILIDFEDKQGHAMKLEFAAKALAAIGEDHVLAQRFSEPEKLKALAADDAPGLMRSVLESHGLEMSLDEVETVLKGSVIEEASYKSWWDSTKKKLRQDRSFIVPSKRNEPLVLRTSDLSPADALMQDYEEAKTLKDKAKALSAIQREISVFKSAPEKLQSVVDEVNEAANRSVKMDPGAVVELVATRDEMRGAASGLKAPEDELTIAEIVRRQEGDLAQLLGGFSVSRQRLVLASFPEAFGEKWAEACIGLLDEGGPKVIAEVCKVLVENDQNEILAAYLNKGIRDRALSSDMVAWICKERKGAAEMVFTTELPPGLMHALERDHYDEGSRKGNRLRDLVLDDKTLMSDLVGPMDVSGVKAFGRRLLMSPVFGDLDTKSLMARIIKTHPETQELMSDESQKEETALVVSWESLERKKDEFEELVQKLIPENSKEIALARSYGDLRENFEYKAAKQQQAVLMRRKTEMQRDLDRARGTDFAEADPSKIAIGTTAVLEDAETGDPLSYTVLGAWDTDVAKRIVAYVSEVGKALIGRGEGEEVELPSAEEGGAPQRMKVVSIEKAAL